ncbi:MAG: response regulator [Chitinophagales bacterium]
MTLISQFQIATGRNSSPAVKAYFKNTAIGIPFLYTLSRLYFSIKTQHKKWGRALLLLTAFFNKKNVNILLADDDEEDQEIFVTALNDVVPDASVSVAKNGRHLMQLLKSSEQLPDLIFLDLNMPIKNGYECLVEIRADKKLSQIPVIIYSTSTSREHIEDTYNKGANFYVCKPESFADLKNIAKKVMSLEWDYNARPTREKFVLKAGNIK